MGTNNLKVKVVHLDDAPDYDSAEWTAVELDSALVIQEGTVKGKPTVDLMFADDRGNKYVAMVTGAIVKQLANIVRGADSSP